MKSMRPELRYGLTMTAGLIIYFLITKILGLTHITELRVLNFFIVLAVLYRAFKTFRERDINKQFNYLQAFMFGFFTTAIGTVVFAVFIFFYIQFLDPALMETVRQKAPLGEYLNPYLVACALIAEGSLSGALATFMLINVKNANQIEGQLNGREDEDALPASTRSAATKTTAAKSAKSAT
ncbi:MAG: DUF4199 domain-containing protein [Bacteroidota bacterium]|jgi:hypothetical protein|nr:MAG: hypothetical protein DIU61_03795 [Bacteroidota bacterium]